MSAVEILHEGKVDEALAELQDEVRKNPADPKLRIFLFQLLAVQGQWDRALTQLNLSGDMDSGALAMVQTYREMLQCESFRHEVFAGTRSPVIFGEPEQWVALLMESLRLTAGGNHEQAQQIRGEAFESAPASSGTLRTATEEDRETAVHSFAWIADADMRLGPVLEAVVNGKYYWIPFHRIQKIQVESPSDLRDFVWAPVHFRWANGGEAVGFIPARYPQSHEHEDPLIRLSRKTDWLPAGDEDVLGVGQRMLTTDTTEFALLDVREIMFDVAETSIGGEVEPVNG